MERRTQQRSAIVKAFEHAGRPLSPQEALELARPGATRLGIATVYRTLKTLTNNGTLKAVNLPGEATARYELCGKAHHHHFHCRTCRQVYAVEGCPGNIESFVPKGYLLENHEIVLYGLCSSCRKPKRR
ncbi:MAG: transcriptional repressor [Planctomycetaceae bacterium]|nr:MAG: transcriptional repressor [Planctomycetaceae bacterium]